MLFAAARSQVPLYELIGLRVKDFAPGRVSMSTALDTAAAWSCDLLCSEGTVCTTIDLKVNFLRPIAVTDEDVEVIATVLHSGSKIMVSEAKMSSKDGKLITVALATFAVISI